MVMDSILIGVGLAGLLAASVCDIRTREVPDWLTYGLICSGVMLRLLYSVAGNVWSYLWYGLVGLAAMLIFGNVLYRTKQWGGGDTKLVIALGVLFATRPDYLGGYSVPFLAVIIINLLIIGALYGVCFAVFLALKERSRFKKEFLKLNSRRDWKVMKFCVLAAAVMLFLWVNLGTEEMRLRLVYNFLLIPLLVLPYLMLFVKAVESGVLYNELPVKKLTEGDWVEEDVYKNKKLVYKKKAYGIEKSDIQRLIKAKIKTVSVKEGIPFVPPFFFAVLFSVIKGTILFLP